MNSIERETEIVLESSPSSDAFLEEQRNRKDGVVIGLLIGFGDSGLPLVVFSSNPQIAALPARSIAKLSHEDIGREIALLFEEGDSTRPVILGPVQHQAEAESAPAKSSEDKVQVAEIDGERIVLSANQEIVLRCGKSSITLTAAGKIIIRGTYLLNYSSGVNRIKGGSVQIN